MPRYGIDEESEDEFQDALSDFSPSPSSKSILDMIPVRDTSTQPINNCPDATKLVSEQKQEFSDFLNNRTTQQGPEILIGTGNLHNSRENEANDKLTQKINNSPDTIKLVSEQKQEFINVMNNRSAQPRTDVFKGTDSLDNSNNHEDNDRLTQQTSKSTDNTKPVGEQKQEFSGLLNYMSTQPKYEDNYTNVGRSCVDKFEKINTSQIEISENKKSYYKFKLNYLKARDTSSILGKLGDLRMELEDSMSEMSSLREMVSEVAQVINKTRMSPSMVSLKDSSNEICYSRRPVSSTIRVYW